MSDIPSIPDEATPMVTVVHPVRLGKILNKPAEYDGKDRNKCNTFIAQLRLYISGNPEVFETEESKVLFAATYLRDRAFAWFEPRLVRSDDDPILHSFNLFCKALLAALGDPDLPRTMLKKIKSLRQTTSATAYRNDFESYAQYVDFNETSLKEYFYDGLKEIIKDAIATAPIETEPKDFDEYKAWVIRIDNRQFERKQEGKGNNKPPSRDNDHKRASSRYGFGRANVVRTSVPISVSGPAPMDIDATRSTRFSPLSKEERQRRMNNNLCLYCGKAGHRAVACPSKGTPRPQRIQATLTRPPIASGTEQWKPARYMPPWDDEDKKATVGSGNDRV